MSAEPQHTTIFNSILTPSNPRIAEIFELYSVCIKKAKNVAQNDLAVLYGNYKQAKCGNNTSAEPWFYEFVASEKWKAWTACKDKPAEYAMFDYCLKAEQLLLAEFGYEHTRHIMESNAELIDRQETRLHMSE